MWTPETAGVKPDTITRCAGFSSNFPELAACQRANGTLESFGDAKITWRVRYFVRFWEMPCGEAPTVQEGYVFHMVTNDLYNDPDMNDAERMAIRAAMFGGLTRCK